MKTSFIVPYQQPLSRVVAPIVRSNSLLPLKASLHPFYDVAAVSTYIAYFTAQYWTGYERRDVEIFAVVLGILWNFTMHHDPTIFLYLWIIGGVCHFVSMSFLAGGNAEEADRFRVGIQLGGYMSFLLMCFDLLDVVFGV